MESLFREPNKNNQISGLMPQGLGLFNRQMEITVQGIALLICTWVLCSMHCTHGVDHGICTHTPSYVEACIVPNFVILQY